jgi:hypothetical protein
MHPNEDADQHVVEGVVKIAIIWDQKHIKVAR